ncbi:MAG TPA: hypothetical protein VII44_07695 [Puia sp.]
MRKILSPLFILFFIGCKTGKKAPDVSNIPVTVHIERFDQAFFAIDTNHVEQGLLDLGRQYPYFINDFAVNILGTGPLSDTSAQAFFACRRFVSSYMPVKDSLDLKFGPAFGGMAPIEKGLQKGFQYIRYYFPKYNLPPKVVAYIGPFDAPGIALTQYTLAIGLQLYAGKQFPFYLSSQGQELFPVYISRRFEPEYVVPNCMKALAEDLFPDQTQGKALIEQMVEKGKSWWLIDQFLPEMADSLKTGFTEKQLKWCLSNEGQIWNYFLDQNLYSLEPDLIKNYIGDAPYTQGMPDASPGNIGQWVGWRIVQKYASLHSDISPEQLMKTPDRTIFDEVKYKPK